MAYFLYFFKKGGSIKPISVRKNAIIGSSNIRPLASAVFVIVPIYELMLIWFVTTSLTTYDPRKCIESGIMMKYPNITPAKKRNEAANTAPLAYFFSFTFSAGFKNLQNSHKQKGMPGSHRQQVNYNMSGNLT